MKDNPLMIRCHLCNDTLTSGELRVMEYKRHDAKPQCYSCTKSIAARKQKEWNERWPIEPNEERENKL